MAGSNKKRADAGTDPGTDSRTDGELVLASFEELSDSWTFCTSPDGLNLTPERFWSLSWAAIHRLIAFHKRKANSELRRWAVGIADMRNLVGRYQPQWTVEEVLGQADREARIAEYQAEKNKAEIELMKMQRGLGSVTKDSPNLPSWAIPHGSGPGGGWSDEEIARAVGKAQSKDAAIPPEAAPANPFAQRPRGTS